MRKRWKWQRIWVLPNKLEGPDIWKRKELLDFYTGHMGPPIVDLPDLTIWTDKISGEPRFVIAWRS